MKNLPLLCGLACLLYLLLPSCYPKVKILAKWPDGNLKLVRHTKRHDSLKERLVEYYDNGKKESVKYWNNDLDPYEMKAWYDNGAKEACIRLWYKDTNRQYNNADSVYVLKGLVKYSFISWYKNGKPEEKLYTYNGKLIREQYDEKGICVQKTPDRNIAAGNYDSVIYLIAGKAYTRNIMIPYKGY